jgi:crotonobetainyl-CoA:carnitine CoA-transferase CaiB-like acyl-CoA transferase
VTIRAPLRGLRVLTFEHFGATPFGSLYLADLGAEVIKIENRKSGGDASRAVGPYFLGQHDSEYFQTFNLNKKSVTVDVKHPEGRAVFHRLVSSADSVMNNLRGDLPVKLGLDYATLKEVNPRLVCVHLSAYGRDNERASWPGYDYLMQAEAGFMHLTGEPDAPPTRGGLSMIDYMSGITASLALVSALLRTRETGEGGDIDVSLFDVALHQLSYPGTWYLNESADTGRLPRGAHPSNVPVQLFRTQDGWIFVMCMTDKFWNALLGALAREDLGQDQRFADMASRRAHRDTLTEILDAEFEREPTATWLAKLQGLLPAAPVYTMGDALDSRFVDRIGMVRSTPHPERGDFRTLASPIRLDGERAGAVAGPALGADTDALLGALGYSEQELAELRRKEVI